MTHLDAMNLKYGLTDKERGCNWAYILHTFIDTPTWISPLVNVSVGLEIRLRQSFSSILRSRHLTSTMDFPQNMIETESMWKNVLQSAWKIQFVRNVIMYLIIKSDKYEIIELSTIEYGVHLILNYESIETMTFWMKMQE